MLVAPYHIEQFKNCILVTLRGDWDMATNIRYLGELSDCLKQRSGKPFHLIVDMRSWQDPKSDSNMRMKSTIRLDRRNQLSELWLEDENSDTGHIVENFFADVSFPLDRTQSLTEFFSLCETKAEPLVVEYIKSWVAQNS
ncbi:MAG: arginine decarboxylase [Pseudomonadota bacterium]|nr:arginine decarboxylase [Pseudomonadota bacterium]